MNKKTKKQSNDYKIIAVIVAIIIIAIIILAIAISKTNKNKELKLDEFEKIAVYGYLEDNVLDVTTLYQKSGKSNFDEFQLFQAKLKQVLDEYFVGTTDNSVETSTILGLIDSKYVPENVDFHGILVSDYEFNSEKDTFVKAPGAYAGMGNIETEINNVEYSNKKATIQKIEKQEKNKYKVSFNIVDNMMTENNIIDSTGDAIINLKDGNIVIESCEINN